MAKQATKPAQAATQAPAQAAPVVGVQNGVTAPTPQASNVTPYIVVPPKRPLTGIKYGQAGNAYTHAALALSAAANGGVLTAAQAYAVCQAANHKGFYSYAVKRLQILVPAPAAALQNWVPVVSWQPVMPPLG